MTARRAVILVMMAGVVHNSLRLIANAAGVSQGIFNYVPPYHWKPAAAPSEGPTIIVLSIILIAIAAVAIYGWRKPQGEFSQSLWASSFWAAVMTVPFGVFAVVVSTSADVKYGWALFVLVPAVTGFLATLLLAQRRPIDSGDAVMASVLSILLLGVALIACAVEGLVCLLMALPIALPLAIVGGGLAYLIYRSQVGRHPAAFLLIAGLTPFGAGVERVLLPANELFAVTTAIDVPASPERVWQTILQPAKLPPPSNAIFRSGVAYPLASHIEGVGPSAIRYCDFSTGKLVEPVLIWNDRRQLRFRVASNPLPMQEWTPYAQIHPPHLDGFLVSKQGEFRLTALAGGGTRLEATTWYQHHLAPARYWRLWSDHIIHEVHHMVLENIRERAVSSASTESAAAFQAIPARPVRQY